MKNPAFMTQSPIGLHLSGRMDNRTTLDTPSGFKTIEQLSTLIWVALEDLQRVEQDPNYAVMMSMWHNRPSGLSICYVCWGGAVLAKTYGISRDQHVHTKGVTKHPAGRQLQALDLLRQGYVRRATALLTTRTMSPESELATRYITPYALSRDGFHRDLRQLASDLEAAGY